MSDKIRTLLVTGASGFIAANCIKWWLDNTNHLIVMLDTFKFKGQSSRLAALNHSIMRGEYGDRVSLYMHDLNYKIDSTLFYILTKQHDIDTIINFASDSSVAHSVSHPMDVWENNTKIIGTMLEFLRHHNTLKVRCPAHFIHISTDEVYGEYTGKGDDRGHVEYSEINPSNVYAASKAAQENLCYAYWRTFEMPITIVNTMNNFGNMQDPEKFIPCVIRRLLNNEEILVYTDIKGVPGSRVYLHTDDHARALYTLTCLDIINSHSYNWRWNGERYIKGDFKNEWIDDSPAPSRYNVCGSKEYNNLEVVEAIAEVMNRDPIIKFVRPEEVRPGYDKRYLLCGDKMQNLGFVPNPDFKSQLKSVVQWSLLNPQFLAGAYA